MRERVKEIFLKINLFFRRPKYSNKVFCIGYNKTGTTSCGRAFELLGYRNLSFDQKIWREDYKNARFDKIINYASRFDSFDDLPWLKEDMIALLDKSFPNSKFVYLQRDEESWSKSLYSWSFKRTGKYPNMEKELQDFRKHKIFVEEYFKNRKEDLLTISISDEDALKRLAKFLGKQTAFTKMPHENKTI